MTDILAVETETVDVQVENTENVLVFISESSPRTLLVDHEEDPVLVIQQPPSTSVVLSSEGLQGPPGRGIESVERTVGDGSPGSYDVYTIKYTDGTVTTFTIYNGMDGDGSGGSGTALAVHIADETPHPAYDDMIDLVVQFENKLV